MISKGKRIMWILLALLLSAAVAGCSATDGDEGDGDRAGEELIYVVIDPQSEEFEALYQGDFKQWYDSTFDVDGLHSFVQDGQRYLLVSAGERPSGGYWLEDLVLTGTEEEIEVTVRLRVPAPGEQVTEALTYPHLLVRIPDDGRQLVYGGLSDPGIVTPPKDTDDSGQAPDGSVEEHTDSGRFIGWIDNNSVEIQISGVPDEMGPRVFRLSGGAHEQLQQLGIEDGEVVLFTFKTEGQTDTIIKIMRLEN